jgi:hypothetical protein
MIPMLSGEDTTLGIPQQWTMTRWAIKTAMVFEYVTHQRSLFYTDDERASVRSTEQIPSHSFAWLARYTRGPEGCTLATIGVDGYPANAAAATVTPYLTTLVFGQLLIQVITVRPYEGEERGARIHPTSGPWHLNSLRIWPNDKAIAWPPQLAVDDKSLGGFHRRWHNPTNEPGGWTGDDVIFVPPTTTECDPL